ncbi:7200_t:CDS:1, partial [Scutellospora calospora]
NDLKVSLKVWISLTLPKIIIFYQWSHPVFEISVFRVLVTSVPLNQ